MKTAFRLAALASIIFAAVAVLIVLLFADGNGGDDDPDIDLSTYPYPVEAPPLIEERGHFDLGVTYDDYTSDPPTSGPHARVPANPGISDLAIPKEQAVHNMEHGDVVVWYNCNAGQPLSNEECAQLRNDLSQGVQAQIAAGNDVLMTPYPAMGSRIALTSWGYLDKFDAFDAARVEMFIETFECNYDPEGFC
jgi:hypothetical protein